MANASLSTFWNARTPSERTLLKAMLGVFTLLALGMVFYSFSEGQSEIETEIAEYQSTLKLLSAQGPTYAKAKADLKLKSKSDTASQKFAPERLKNNKVQLTSLVAELAQKSNIKVDKYDEDELALSSGKDGGPVIKEKILRFDVRDAEMPNLLALLDAIERSTEPVFIKRINLREVRRKEGHVRAYVTLATYIQKDQES